MATNANLYMVYLVSRTTTIKLQNDMTASVDDWFRIGPSFWIVQSRQSAANLYEKLKRLTSHDGILLIIKLDPKDRQGWMTKEFWDWLDPLAPL